MSELVFAERYQDNIKWQDFGTIKVMPRAKEDGLLPSEGTSSFGNAHEKIQPCVDVVWCGRLGVRVLESKEGEVWFHLFCPSVHQCLFILLDCNSLSFPSLSMWMFIWLLCVQICGFTFCTQINMPGFFSAWLPVYLCVFFIAFLSVFMNMYCIFVFVYVFDVILV